MAYIGKQPTVGNFVKLDTITTSATDTYNLLNGGVAYSPQSPNHCIVSLNGVIQSPTTSFTISGSTIVFASALTSSDVIDFILVLGDVLNIGTPSDATVGFSKVTSNLITGATAETSIAGDDNILIYDDSATALRKMTRTNFVSGLSVGITLGTEVASTSGTSITFTGLPSTVKRITIIFNGVSTNGTSLPLVQIGSGSITTTGYDTYSANSTGAGFSTNTNGFLVTDGIAAANLIYGTIVLNLISSNTFIANGEIVIPNKFSPSAGKSPALGGALDRVRITTANGTDTFDAGTINISYE